jgi:CO/xanthine dehydrogenase Mo-binding subunit
MTEQRVPYVDSQDRVTGSVPFVLNMSLPGMLHAAVARSESPHARLMHVNVSAAREVPGVVAVLCGADLAALVAEPHFGPVFLDQPILAIDRVRYIGEPIAAVAAVDLDTARYAASLVEAEYEELPAVFDVEESGADGAAVLHESLRRSATFPDILLKPREGTNYLNEFVLTNGDCDAAFAKAAVVLEDEFRTGGTQHVPMETHVALADARGDREIIIWSATQTPYLVRSTIARTFGIPEARVRVVVPTLGSGYGAKTYPKLEPLVAVLSRRAGAPVKLVLTREEEFLTVKNHESLIRIKTGVSADGKLLAREVALWWDAGAYADISPRFIIFGGFYSPGPYRIPNVSVRSHGVYTNKPPSGAFRGFANPQSAYAFESQMDAIADRLGMDPLELRMANLLESGDRYATGEVMQDLHLKQLLQESADAIGLRDEPVSPSEDPPHMRRGKGVAVVMMATITPSTSTANIKVNADGSVNVLSSTVEMGQGSRTALAQIVAQRLKVPLDMVSVVDPDTDVTPFDLTTSASRSTFMMGDAVRGASDDAAEELRRLAAEDLEVDPADLELRDGGFYVVGTGQGATFGEIITRSQRGTVIGRGSKTTEGGLSSQDGQGTASAQWHEASGAVEIVVDTETGGVVVERIHVNTYTGQTINETSAELQLEGSATFGLGQALYEEMEYDTGQITNSNLAEYLVPSIEDVPLALTTGLLESSDPEGEVHGIGENAVGPVPAAIGNAICAATGVRMRDLPITPERLLRALRSHSVAGAGEETS